MIILESQVQKGNLYRYEAKNPKYYPIFAFPVIIFEQIKEKGWLLEKSGGMGLVPGQGKPNWFSQSRSISISL